MATTDVTHLFLFDVDSVLVQADGYLKALQDTVAHFSRRMGVGAHPPTESQVRAFEAGGLTSEWDSAPTCIAALLVERLRRTPSLPLPAQWDEALTLLAQHPHPLPHPDYAALAYRINDRQLDGTAAAEIARAVLWQEVQTTPDLAPQRAALDALFETLLGCTYDFHRAPVTRHFQHLVIGSQGVARTYGVAPDFESGPYLQTHDRPLLTAAARTLLQEHVATGRVRVALYTARPSLPPADVEPRVGYSPEAEMARSLVGLDKYALIGLGRVRWLAEETGEKAARLVKPSPVQALAAIGAAWSGPESAALEAAIALQRGKGLQPPLAGLAKKRITVHVFEDSPGGIDAVRRAVQGLQAAGLAVTWRPHAITPPDSPKATAMAARGVPIASSVNQAISNALETT